MDSAIAAAPRRFFGWHVVSATFVLAAFGWGVGFYGPPIYLHAVIAERGWPLATVSLAVTVHFACGAAVIANLPALYRRFGVPAITRAGAGALALGVVGWATAAAPWQLFAATLLSGAGWVAMGAAAVNAIVAPWFVRKRPAALAMAYNGASAGGIVLSPLWVAAIAAFGFPVAAAAIGAVMLVSVGWLAGHYFAATPQQLGQEPDGEAAPATRAAAPTPGPAIGRALWRDRRFVTLATGMALGLFAQIGLLAHLYSLLVPALGDAGAGLAMSAATAAAIAGRTLVGWLMPAGADRRLVAAASYSVQIAGSAVLLAAGGASAALLLIGVALFGSGIGHATSLPPLIAQAEFAREDVGRVVALVVAIAQATYAFAPAALGVIRALAGGGDGAAVFIAAATIQALAAAALLGGRRAGP